jgi:hypothetical protein
MAYMEVWEERKLYLSVGDKLWNKAKGMINVAFIDSFNHRKAAYAVRNLYAEHIRLQT